MVLCQEVWSRRAANPTPLGTLDVKGNPAATFGESPGPLFDAAAAQDLYFAAVRAAKAGNAAAWSVIAPSNRYPSRAQM